MVISRLKLFRFLAIMLLITTYLPLYLANMPFPIRSHHFWVILWFGSLILFFPSLYKQKPIKMLFFYGVLFVGIGLNTVWSDTDPWNQKLLVNEFYQIIVAISLLTYFKLSKDFAGLRKVVIWAIGFILITAVMSIYSSFIDPMYARLINNLAAFIGTDQEEQIMAYHRLGGGSYGFALAIMAIFPVLYYHYKKRQRIILGNRDGLWIMLFLFTTLVLIQIFANILVSILFIIISVFRMHNMKAYITVVTFLLILVLMLPIELYADFIYYLATWFNPDSEIYFKLTDIAQVIDAGYLNYDSAVGFRAARYPVLFSSFLDNPIIGGDIWNGHLYWMNKLATYGILGFIPIALIIKVQVQENLQIFDDSFSYYYLTAIISVIFLGFMKALGGREIWITLLFLLPSMYFIKGIPRENSAIQKRD
jgi:hypothetical protein